MASVNDRWHKSRPKPGELLCVDHELVPSVEHGKGDRWQVRWLDGGHSGSRNFPDRDAAEWHLEHIDGSWCLVPRCGGIAVTEPPVLLCGPHLDAAVRQAPRKRRPAHESLVYFVRNGNRIKIGHTSNLKVRLTQMSAPAGSVVLTFPGGLPEEKRLHYVFATARVGRSEWFEATPEIEEYIAGRLAADAEAA